MLVSYALALVVIEVGDRSAFATLARSKTIPLRHVRYRPGKVCRATLGKPLTQKTTKFYWSIVMTEWRVTLTSQI